MTAHTPPLSSYLQEVDVDDIVVGKRHRKIDQEIVDQLAKDIAKKGLINPITVAHEVKTRKSKLIAGAHRLAAVKAIGWKRVRCVVYKVSADDELLIEALEIVENLIRNDLTPAQRAKQTKRLASIEKDRLKVRGLNAKLADKVATPRDRMSAGGKASVKGGAKELAKAYGLKERTVQRDVQRADVLGDEALEAIEDSELDTGVELDALVKLKRQGREEEAEAIVSQMSAPWEGDHYFDDPTVELGNDYHSPNIGVGNGLKPHPGRTHNEKARREKVVKASKVLSGEAQAPLVRKLTAKEVEANAQSTARLNLEKAIKNARLGLNSLTKWIEMAADERAPTDLRNEFLSVLGDFEVEIIHARDALEKKKATSSSKRRAKK